MTKQYHRIRVARQWVGAAIALAVTAAVALGARCVATRMQLFPAIMAGSAVWLGLWSVATLLLGRIYCSTACPMGTLMDVAARLRIALERRRRGRATRYRYEAPSLRGRYSVLAVTGICVALGFTILPSLLDPYSAYARIVAAARCAVVSPAGRAAGIGIASAVVALATLGVVAAVAWRRGRHICTTWCPIGSTLGLVSRYSLYHADVNTDLCVRCSRCADVCKASCIDPADMTVDTSRCVVCFDCMDVCPTGVLRPSTREFGLGHTLQPVMDYSAAACATDCNRCTQVCPSGAIMPLTLGEKRRFVIGKARIRLQNCLAYGRGETCGRCARRCPYGALTMTVFSDGRRGPQLDLTKCTGCGQCETVCPSEPYKAIVIEGTD